MSRVFKIKTSWPAYVQERDDTPFIYKTGVISHWKEQCEANKKREEYRKALDKANELLSMLRK